MGLLVIGYQSVTVMTVVLWLGQNIGSMPRGRAMSCRQNEGCRCDVCRWMQMNIGVWPACVSHPKNICFKRLWLRSAKCLTKISSKA